MNPEQPLALIALDFDHVALYNTQQLVAEAPFLASASRYFQEGHSFHIHHHP
jgi:hypothetical protein